MKNKLLLFFGFLSLFVIPVLLINTIKADDTQTMIVCGGDEQTTILCSIDDSGENINPVIGDVKTFGAGVPSGWLIGNWWWLLILLVGVLVFFLIILVLKKEKENK